MCDLIIIVLFIFTFFFVVYNEFTQNPQTEVGMVLLISQQLIVELIFHLANCLLLTLKTVSGPVSLC